MMKNSFLSCLVVIGFSGILRSLEFPLRLAMSGILAITLVIIWEMYRLIFKDIEFSLKEFGMNLLGVTLGIIIRIYV